MAAVSEIASRSDFEQVLELSHTEPVILFKHSTACGLSARGFSQFLQVADGSSTPLFRVVVQAARDASNYIEERLGVRHETPQALIIAGGRVTYHASHHRIITSELRSAAEAAAESLSTQ